MIKLNYDKPTLLKDIRYENRMTAKEVASKLDISPGAYHHLEHGNTWPSFGTILKIMEVFGVPFRRIEQYFRERENYITENAIRTDRRIKHKEK